VIMTAPVIEYRAASGLSAAGRVLSGYAAVYGQETRIGQYRERIAQGAFKRTLGEDRDILALADHDPKQVLGRTKSRTLQLREDGHGLHFTLELPDTQAGRDVATLAQRGDLGGMSFGFVATDETWDGEVRTLRDVDLHEISVVSAWPAYQQTEMSLRNKPMTPTVGIWNGREFAWLQTC